MPDLKIIQTRAFPTIAPENIPIKLDSSWIMEGTVVAQQQATGEAIKCEVPTAQGTPSQPYQAQLKNHVEMTDATMPTQQPRPTPNSEVKQGAPPRASWPASSAIGSSRAAPRAALVAGAGGG